MRFNVGNVTSMGPGPPLCLFPSPVSLLVDARMMLKRDQKRCRNVQKVDKSGLLCALMCNHRSPPVLLSKPGFTVRAGRAAARGTCGEREYQQCARVVHTPAVGPGMCKNVQNVQEVAQRCASNGAGKGGPERGTTVRIRPCTRAIYGRLPYRYPIVDNYPTGRPEQLCADSPTNRNRNNTRKRQRASHPWVSPF